MKLKMGMAQVQHVWTMYFELELAADEKDSAGGEDSGHLDDIDEISSCKFEGGNHNFIERAYILDT